MSASTERPWFQPVAAQADSLRVEAAKADGFAALDRPS